MLTHTLLSLMIAVGGVAADRAGDLAWRAGEQASAVTGSLDSSAAEPRYAAPEREVTNWRLETAADLEPAPLAVLAALVEADRPVVTRCVKLNNYWCIKSARWNGEIGTDDEGHVGFASAERGADAAATLLRRYYLEFGRKSALDIVRRWAPAECRVTPGASTIAAGSFTLRGITATVRARYLASRRRVGAPRPAAKPLPTLAAAAAPATPSPSPAGPPEARPALAATKPASPAVRVVTPPGSAAPPGSTGPARRVLPSSRKPAAAPSPRVSAIVPPAPPTFRVPDIAAGMGERPRSTISSTLPYRVVPPRSAPTRVATSPKPAGPATPPSPAAAGATSTRVATPPKAVTPAAPPSPVAAVAPVLPLPAPAPQVNCAPDEQRLRNYAGRIVESLGLGPDDDLKLFEPDGTPTPNLAPVLLAMSSFELGMLRPSPALVDGAVERQAQRARIIQETDGAAPPPAAEP